jgi:hypothetical protein
VASDSDKLLVYLIVFLPCCLKEQEFEEAELAEDDDDPEAAAEERAMELARKGTRFREVKNLKNGKIRLEPILDSSEDDEESGEEELSDAERIAKSRRESRHVAMTLLTLDHRLPRSLP